MGYFLEDIEPFGTLSVSPKATRHLDVTNPEYGNTYVLLNAEVDTLDSTQLCVLRISFH